jgi:DMSO/TMAO reductase YedYZ molybdopterin-dependent catalytic subunit
MTRNDVRRTVSVAAALLWAGSIAGPKGIAHAQAAPGSACTIRITGDVPADTTLRAADLRTLPHRELRAADHGRDSTSYSVVRLADVLRAAGARIGPGPKGQGVAQYVVARAADEYRAVYAVAELDSAITPGGVWLADSKQGSPLSPEEGPCRLLVPTDRRHARSVRQVTTIEFHQVR